MHYKEGDDSGADYQQAEASVLNRLREELPATLSYHGYHHTEDVMNAAMQIADAENVSEEDKKLLRVAVAFHDAGFIYIYKDHEEKGCDMVKAILPSFKFSPEHIEMICGMIRATKIPQQPQNKLEQIIADADLDYLGRDDVFPIAQTLFEELKIHAGLTDEKTWNLIQVNFLKSHHYHTSYAQKLRTNSKQEYLERLMKEV